MAGATYYAQFGNCTTNTDCQTPTGRYSFSALTNDQAAFAEPATNGDRTNIGASLDAGERTTCGASVVRGHARGIAGRRP